MLTKLYIETLPVDEDLADQIWDEWEASEIDNEAACIAWMLIALCSSYDQHGANRET